MLSFDATDRASAVVGLYGDPTISWSILLRADLDTLAKPDEVRARLSAATWKYPHLGAVPEVTVASTEELPEVRDRFAMRTYRRGEPLVRVAVGATDPVLLLATHHGALDGLGTLALLGLALDCPVASGALGLADRPSGRTFVASAVSRLAEALFTPPTRIAPHTDEPGLEGDVFAERHLPRIPLGAAGLTSAATRAACRWNTAHQTGHDRIVAAIGASRRSGADPLPVNDSTWLRLRVPGDTDPERLRAILAEQPPEPDFPARSSRLATLITRTLAGRLGSTFLTSNLGVVAVRGGVRALSFYPCAGGRSGVAFGAVTTDDRTTITLRARRRDFDEPAARELLGELVRGFDDPGPRRG
jgi:hypothetical protein